MKSKTKSPELHPLEEDPQIPLRSEREVTIELDLADEKEIAEMMRKIEGVIPEKILNRFGAIGDLEEQLQWEKGDLTNDIWLIVEAKKLKNKKGRRYQFLDICYFVTKKFLRNSRSFNTVKAWALTARRYSPEIRAMYSSDLIPFSHFAYAAKRKFDVDSQVTGLKVWQDILQDSLDFYHQHMKYKSVRALEEKFEGVKKSNVKYQTGVYRDREVDMIHPVSIIDLQGDTKPYEDLSLEAEFREFAHKFEGFLHRFSAKYPKFSNTLTQSYTLIRQVIDNLTR